MSGLLRARVVVGCALLLAATGCGSSGAGSAASSGSSASTSASPSVPQVRGVAMTKPGALTRPLLTPDLLVSGSATIPAATVARIRRLPGVTHVETFSLAQFFVEEHNVSYAAVDPATFRRYTPPGSAQTLAVWDRVAAGEMAISPSLGRRIADRQGYVRMGNDTGSPRVHIGAYAEMVPRVPGTAPYVDAVVNQRWASRLHMRTDNALIVSIGERAPRPVRAELRRILGDRAGVRILGVDLDVGSPLTAVLTGGPVSGRIGVLRYTANADGTVDPDPAWVRTYIRTETVPILGRVRCNKVMLPELRGALTEVVSRGLASKIHPGEYGGCFVPRYIARDPSRGLSFHTFGTALDLNVPGNQRGTVGQMDRQVVAIFEKWGFQWGGTWHYTDPMHFELHRIVTPRKAS